MIRPPRRPSPGALQALRTVQVGDTLFGQDVGDVITINHYRRQRYAGGFRHLNCIQRLNEGWFHAGWKVSTICTTSFFPRCIGSGSVIILSHAGVAATVRVVAHVRRAAGKTAAGDGRGVSQTIHLQG